MSPAATETPSSTLIYGGGWFSSFQKRKNALGQWCAIDNRACSDLPSSSEAVGGTSKSSKWRAGRTSNSQVHIWNLGQSLLPRTRTHPYETQPYRGRIWWAHNDRTLIQSDSLKTVHTYNLTTLPPRPPGLSRVSQAHELILLLHKQFLSLWTVRSRGRKWKWLGRYGTKKAKWAKK